MGTTATRVLLGGAFAWLLVTAVSGALDGAGLLRTAGLHGPAGTLGWLGLGVLAIATVILPLPATRYGATHLGWLPVAALSGYALATWTDVAERVAAVLALAAILGFAAALVAGARGAAPLTVPQLGVAAAVAILASVPVLALLPEVDAGRVPFRLAGARSPSIAALAVLAGTALAEQRLAAPRRAASDDTWGLAQVLLFVVGWVALLAGAAADSLELLVASAGIHVVAVVAFLARLASRWQADRWAAAALLYLAAYVGLLAHLAAGVAGGRYLDAGLVPEWLLFAVDHVVFVGVVANLLLGLQRATRAVFWAVNLGLVGAAVGLAADAAFLARPAAAVLGLGLALGAAQALLPPVGPNGTGRRPAPWVASDS